MSKQKGQQCDPKIESKKEQKTEPIGPVVEYELKIREGHLDSFGHVNNSKYLEIFEEARWEILDSHGYGLKKVHEVKQGPVILDLRVQFQRELRNREQIKIKSYVTVAGEKIFVMRQVMYKASGEEACIADFTFGLFDMALRKLIPATAAWKKALGLE